MSAWPGIPRIDLTVLSADSPIVIELLDTDDDDDAEPAQHASHAVRLALS